MIIPNSWGSRLREFNPHHEPAGSPKGGQFASKPGHTALFRGDANTVNPSLSHADPRALFGAGIYLTDNRRVAGDYTKKGPSDDVVFRFSSKAGTFSKQDVIDRYIRQSARFIDKHGNALEYDTALSGYGEGFDKGSRPYLLHQEDEARLGHARKAWAAKAKDYDVRVNLDGTATIARKGQGQLSVYDVPDSWIAKTLDAEDYVTDDVAAAVANAVPRGRQSHDIYAFGRREDEGGFRPTYRQLYRFATDETAMTVGGFDEPETQEKLRANLKALGFKGIRYAGGLTMGGGAKHNAYVFWDEQGLKKRRRP